MQRCFLYCPRFFLLLPLLLCRVFDSSEPRWKELRSKHVNCWHGVITITTVTTCLRRYPRSHGVFVEKILLSVDNSLHNAACCVAARSRVRSGSKPRHVQHWTCAQFARWTLGFSTTNFIGDWVMEYVYEAMLGLYGGSAFEFQRYTLGTVYLLRTNEKKLSLVGRTRYSRWYRIRGEEANKKFMSGLECSAVQL